MGSILIVTDDTNFMLGTPGGTKESVALGWEDIQAIPDATIAVGSSRT